MMGMSTDAILVYGIPLAEGAVSEAWRGAPKPVPETLSIDPGWAELVRAYVSKHGLTAAGEAGWWLCSDYS